MAQEKLSVADVQRGTDPRKKPIPGATPYVPTPTPDAQEYVVVNSPVFYGRLYEIGETIRHPGPLIPELGSPGRCMKPVNYAEDQPWPPRGFADKEKAADKKARREWVKDLASKI